MKKFACVTLSAFMMLTSIAGLAACNKDNSEGNVVVTYIQGDRDKPDFELVQKTVSDYCQEKLGFGITFKPTAVWDQDVLYTKWLSGGEDIDVINLAFTDQMQYIKEKRIREMDSLLTEENAPNLISLLEKYASSKLVGTDGKLYGIGTIEPIEGTTGGSIIIRKDVMEKCGLLGTEGEYKYEDYEKVDYTDLDYIFNAIKSNPETNKTASGATVYPCPVLPATDPCMAFAPCDPMSNDTVAAVLPRNADGTFGDKVVNYYEMDSYKQFVEKMGEWQAAGYIHKDATTTPDSYDTLLKNGQFVSMFLGISAGLRNSYENDYDAEFIELLLCDPYYTFNGVPQMSLSISSKSKRSAKAMKFIDLLYSDEYLINLIQYGIEDKHWYRLTDDEETRKYIAIVPENDEQQLYAKVPGVYGNKAMIYAMISGEGNVEEAVAKAVAAETKDYEFADIAKANASPAAGFRYDRTEMNNRLRSINSNAIARYKATLACGKGKKGSDGTWTGPGSAYADFIAALKSNKIELVVEDKQSQYDAWLASK